MRISDWSSDVCSSDLIPIVDDKIALRLAGQIRRQDPRTKNLSGGKGFDDIHQDSFRASLLVEPADGVKSITVFDYFKVHEQSGGGLIYRLNPGAVPGISELIDSQLAAYYQGQQNNFHGTYRSEEHTSELQSLMRI